MDAQGTAADRAGQDTSGHADGEKRFAAVADAGPQQAPGESPDDVAEDSAQHDPGIAGAPASLGEHRPYDQRQPHQQSHHPLHVRLLGTQRLPRDATPRP